MSSLAVGVVGDAAGLVIAAAAMDRVTLSARGLLIAVAIMEAGFWIPLTALRFVGRRFGGHDEVGVVPFLFFLGPVLLMAIWIVASVPVADAMTDGFNVDGLLPLAATAVLVVSTDQTLSVAARAAERRLRG